mgnify:CR=1 FL=1
MPAFADPIRLATFAAPLSRDGPGLLLRDLGRDDPLIAASVAIINAVQPDILLLTDIDHDHDAFALSVLRARLGYSYQFTATPNAGQMTDMDLDQNGRIGEPQDAQGFGRFAGDGGMAILSQWPIGDVTDLSDMLWIDLPDAKTPEGWPAEVLAIQRLSSVNHWIVPIEHPDGLLHLMAFAPTPPVFDGPEDRNGLRNADELRLWTHVLDTQPPDDFIVLGNANLDPQDGDGRSAVMRDFLADPRIKDPLPKSAGALVAPDAGHSGNPALDTTQREEIGNLRVDYVLPAASWTIIDAGVFWPAPDDPLTELLGSDGLAAGPHRLVWVDVSR